MTTVQSPPTQPPLFSANATHAQVDGWDSATVTTAFWGQEIKPLAECERPLPTLCLRGAPLRPLWRAEARNSVLRGNYMVRLTLLLSNLRQVRGCTFDAFLVDELNSNAVDPHLQKQHETARERHSRTLREAQLSTRELTSFPDQRGPGPNLWLSVTSSLRYGSQGHACLKEGVTLHAAPPGQSRKHILATAHLTTMSAPPLVQSSHRDTGF